MWFALGEKVYIGGVVGGERFFHAPECWLHAPNRASGADGRLTRVWARDFAGGRTSRRPPTPPRRRLCSKRPPDAGAPGACVSCR